MNSEIPQNTLRLFGFSSFEFSGTEKLFSLCFTIVVLLCENFHELKGIIILEAVCFGR